MCIRDRYVGSPEANGEREMVNNHGSWYDVTWSAVASFNGNWTGASAAAHELNQRRIAYQILPNGSEWIELQRNVPSSYCQYNVLALSQGADIAASNADAGAADVWSFATADGRSLRRAIDWLLPFATGAKPWPYPQPDPPDWMSFLQTLRRASVALSNRSYEEAACTLMRQAGRTHEYRTATINVQLPPLFLVDCVSVELSLIHI